MIPLDTLRSRPRRSQLDAKLSSLTTTAIEGERCARANRNIRFVGIRPSRNATRSDKPKSAIPNLGRAAAGVRKPPVVEGVVRAADRCVFLKATRFRVRCCSRRSAFNYRDRPRRWPAAAGMGITLSAASRIEIDVTMS